MLPHSLTNFEIQKYYQNKPKFNGSYLRNDLPETMDGTNVNNLDEYKSKGTHQVALYVDDDNVTYFDSFGVEYIKKKKKFIKTKVSQQIFLE